MNKTVSSLLLAGALLLGSVAPVVANAATGDDTGKTGQTENTITFTKPDGTNVDPADPNNPGTKDPNGGNGGVDTPDPTKTGDLTFLYVSPNMDFGSHVSATSVTSSNKPTVTTADLGTTKTNANLLTEVQDTRGTNAGWTVNVTADQMKDTAGDVLKGATLQLDASNATITNSAVSDTSTGYNKGDQNLPAGIVGSDGTISTDTATHTIYSAQAGSGMLVTAFQLAPENITLGSIPANVKAGTYTGNLNWTLTDTPGA
ncbi:WxL domain-containing protein [Levilactobacillus fujinensis]|uniref:WxL domain-containing protein n=1 Tax=Levilactobacillus fujinensis TaxID=2486024 RepID=A0ABW1TFB5_9LACO|nr:WxL domain-containing protein [Levilactobacillus fujinensis]